jgi:hypothetical protein
MLRDASVLLEFGARGSPFQNAVILFGVDVQWFFVAAHDRLLRQDPAVAYHLYYHHLVAAAIAPAALLNELQHVRQIDLLRGMLLIFYIAEICNDA